MGHLAYFFRRKPTVLVMQVGAVLLLVASVIGWVTVSSGAEEFSLNGAALTPLVRVVGVLGVVAGLLVTISRHWIRAVLASLVLGGGVITLIAAVTVLVEPAGAAEAAVTARGVAADNALVDVGVGAVMGLLGAVILCIGSVAVLLFSPSWDDEDPAQGTS